MFSRVSNWVMIGFYFVIIFFNVAMAPVDKADSMISDPFSYFLSSSDTPMVIITTLSIIWAAGIMAAEFSTGTIKLLLIRPVTRTKILWAKYTLVVLYALILTVLYYVLTIMFGFLLYTDASFASEGVTTLAKAAGLSLLESFFMITLTYMVAVLSYNRSLALGLSMFLYLTNTVIAFFMQTKPWSKFLFFTQLNLTKYATHDGAISAPNTLAFALCVLGVYFILFIAATWVVFSNRDVAS
jgi:ABC-2 type transport system permease protein